MWGSMRDGTGEGSKVKHHHPRHKGVPAHRTTHTGKVTGHDSVEGSGTTICLKDG